MKIIIENAQVDSREINRISNIISKHVMSGVNSLQLEALNRLTLHDNQTQTLEML